MDSELENILAGLSGANIAGASDPSFSGMNFDASAHSSTAPFFAPQSQPLSPTASSFGFGAGFDAFGGQSTMQDSLSVVDSDLASILGALSSSSLTSAAPAGAVFASMDLNASGTCAQCGLPVDGQAVHALDQLWHIHHFACADCQTPFMGAPFLPVEDKAYCEKCYAKTQAVRCCVCSEAILDRCITALGKKYHPEHFSCNECKMSLAGKGYFNHEGSPICRDCKVKLEKIASGEEIPKCGRCGYPIYGEYIILGGKKIHPEHFACTLCGIPLKGGSSFELDGTLYCEKDYNFLVHTTCAGCKQPIEGRAISALDRQWHPEHFICADCEKPFDGAKHFEKDGKAYCAIHYHTRFGQICMRCSKPILTKALATMNHSWHEDCFVCYGCEKKLTGGSFRDYFTKPYCSKCYDKFPADERKKAEKDSDQRKKEEKDKKKKEEKEKKDREKAAAN
eukprot:TRINITY_DN8953_c0_g1_i1.p1 TRINITY_DN8953_c0_g1~~TRINITY_DN8953_c0_g1_i1.p1  ORF type:complete len:452 (-),score=90.87 TRINITY_DN8953_c0_g1_i1:150-1505(-)